MFGSREADEEGALLLPLIDSVVASFVPKKINLSLLIHKLQQPILEIVKEV